MPENTPRVNTSVFSNRSDEWFTPRPLVEALAERFTTNGRFVLDVAACQQSTVARTFFDAAADGLSRDWHAEAQRLGGGAIWCNPPYSAVRDWLAKCARTSRAGTAVVALVPARTDTRAFHDHVLGQASEVHLLKGRLRFTRPDGTGTTAPFPSMVVVYRPGEHDTVVKAMDRDGQSLEVQSLPAAA